MTINPWEQVMWQIDLSRPPEVVAIDKNVHRDDPVDRYCLPELWSLHVYQYSATLEVAGQLLPIRPGFVGLTPPAAPTEYRYHEKVSPHLYVHFRTPGTLSREPIRAMQDAGPQHEAIYQALAEVIPCAHLSPTRASARLWDVLWMIRELPGDSYPGIAQRGAVRKATTIIERNLGQEISVRELAREVGVSYGYLGKLFQAEYGETVIGYIRRRRLDRAMHLLQNSTLPVKMIAASVGIPDLQHFNKVVREYAGKSPRNLRG